MAATDGWNSSAEQVGPAGAASTEALSGVKSEVKTQQSSRKLRPIWIWLMAILAVLVVGGIVVGVLAAKQIIRTGPQNANTDADSVTTGGISSTSEALVQSATQMPSSTAASSLATSTGTTTTSLASSSSGSATPTACSTSDDIPSSVKGTFMDITSWLDMKDFNCTFTSETVGGLPVVGLNSSWDDSKQANSNVPPLNTSWGPFTSRPVRGVNLGGWLALEPFITPSLFNGSSTSGKIMVDEYSLCETLGPKNAAALLEKHYSTFITEDDFKSIAAAGLDHVRIPYSYWAVKVYDNDPYVLGVSWRYLLRGIEWARRYGLRVNLDLHGVPGSQNGWNHSGRQGTVGWISGSNGATNAQRSLDIHNQLSTFFAQDRYKNIVTFYGLVNEPAKSIPQDSIIDWTAKAYKLVKGNGINAVQVFSECLRGLDAWQGDLTGYGDSLVIDVHEYTLFDDALIALKHAEKVSFACKTYTSQIKASLDTSSGFGPTIVNEWSQADTDCATYLNGVGNGARWTGTFADSEGTGSPRCPTLDTKCSCDQANADGSSFTSDYKSFLQTWTASQMSAFENSWGWFYWTWTTEASPLWSYKAGLAGGYMPSNAAKRDWDCSKSVPSFGSLPEYY